MFYGLTWGIVLQNFPEHEIGKTLILMQNYFLMTVSANLLPDCFIPVLVR